MNDNKLTINGREFNVIKAYSTKKEKENAIDMKRFDVEYNKERFHLIIVTSHSSDKIKIKVIDEEMIEVQMNKLKNISHIRKVISKEKRIIDKHTIEYFYFYDYLDQSYLPLRTFITNSQVISDEKVIQSIIRQIVLIAIELDKKRCPINKLIDLDYIYIKEISYLEYEVYIECYNPDYLYKARLSLMEGTERYYSYIKQTEIYNLSSKENKQIDKNYYGILYENQNFVWSIGALAYYFSTKRTLIYSDTRLYFNKSNPISKKFFDFLLQCLNTDHSRRILLSELINIDFISNYDYNRDNPKKSSVFQSSSSFMKSATILEPVDDDPFFTNDSKSKPKLNLNELYKNNYEKSILSISTTFSSYKKEEMREEKKNKLNDYIENNLFNREEEEIKILNESIKNIYLPDNIIDYC